MTQESLQIELLCPKKFSINLDKLVNGAIFLCRYFLCLLTLNVETLKD